MGHKAIFKHYDVTEEADVEELMEAAVSTYGSLDIVMNNVRVLWGLEGQSLNRRIRVQSNSRYSSLWNISRN